MIDFVVTWLDSTDEEYEIINRELQRMLEQKFPYMSSFEKVKRNRKRIAIEKMSLTRNNE